MDKSLEIEQLLRQKLKEVGKKSSARKTALKQLEKAYKLIHQALELSVNQNIMQIQRSSAKYDATLRDYNKLQLDYKELQTQIEYLEECLGKQAILIQRLKGQTLQKPPKSYWWKRNV